MSRILIMLLCLSLAASPALAGDFIGLGDRRVSAVVRKAAEEFKKKHPDTCIICSGQGNFVRLMASGDIQFGMTVDLEKRINPEKMKKGNLVAVTVALKGFCPVVNTKNTLTKITKKQVQDICTGKVTNWKDLGGSDAAISMGFPHRHDIHHRYGFIKRHFDLEAKSDNKKTFFKVKGDPDFSKVGAKIVNDKNAMLALVENNPNCIVFLPVVFARSKVKEGVPIQLLELDGVAPTWENLVSGTYPLRQSFQIVTKGQPQDGLKAFIDYLLSPEGQNIIKANGLTPVSKVSEKKAEEDKKDMKKDEEKKKDVKETKDNRKTDDT